MDRNTHLGALNQWLLTQAIIGDLYFLKKKNVFLSKKYIISSKIAKRHTISSHGPS